MLQKMKPPETPAQEGMVSVSVGDDVVSARAERRTAARDALLAELTAAIEAGLIRNQKRSRVVHKIKYLANFITFGCLTSLSHSVLGFIGWLLLASLINELFVDRTVVDTGFALWAIVPTVPNGTLSDNWWRWTIDAASLR